MAENKYASQPSNDVEFAQQKEDHEFQLQMQQQQHNHEMEMKSAELGYVGKMFGAEGVASRNITALILLVAIVCVSVVSIIVYLKDKDVDFIGKMWGWLSPIITLSLGYLFGKK